MALAAVRQCGGRQRLRDTPLVTPTRDFFPPTDAVGHARAEHVLALVKRHAGMADWPTELIEQTERPPLRVAETVALVMDQSRPSGTFAMAGNRAVITYDPAALDDPVKLVATLAHELCHYRLAAVTEAPPGGAAMAESATDLAAVFFGYGLFGATCAFRFSQHGGTFSQGWQYQRLGYLRPRDWCYALAMFFHLRGEPITSARLYLLPHLWADLRTAAAYLRRQPGLLNPA
jgi:hypothetical protein